MHYKHSDGRVGRIDISSAGIVWNRERFRGIFCGFFRRKTYHPSVKAARATAEMEGFREV